MSTAKSSVKPRCSLAESPAAVMHSLEVLLFPTSFHYWLVCIALKTKHKRKLILNENFETYHPTKSLEISWIFVVQLIVRRRKEKSYNYKILIVLIWGRRKRKEKTKSPGLYLRSSQALLQPNSVITLYCQQQFYFFSRLRVPTHLHHREAFSLYISKLYHKLFLYS